MFEKFNDIKKDLKKEWKRDLAVLAGAVLIVNAGVDVYRAFAYSALPTSYTLEEIQARKTELMKMQIQRHQDTRSGDINQYRLSVTGRRVIDTYCPDLQRYNVSTAPKPREKDFMKFEKLRGCVHYESQTDIRKTRDELERLQRMLKSFPVG